MSLSDLPTETTMTRLRGRLVDQAEGAGLLDVAYRTIDSPIGPLLLAATDAGVVRIAFDLEGHDAVLAELAERVSPRVLAAPRRLDPAARQLDSYFDGALRVLDVAVDLRLVTGFRRTVLEHLPHIPYGSVASYAAVAGAVANPRAVRAVGTACATNPVPLLVPCHRVVRSDGTTGQYRGGPEAKRQLLSLEGAGRRSP